MSKTTKTDYPAKRRGKQDKAAAASAPVAAARGKKTSKSKTAKSAKPPKNKPQTTRGGYANARLTTCCTLALFVPFATLVALGNVGCESAVRATQPSGVVYTHSIPGEALGPEFAGKTFVISGGPDRNLKLRLYYPDGQMKTDLDVSRGDVLNAIQSAVFGIERGRAENFGIVAAALVTEIQRLSTTVLEIQTQLSAARTAAASAPTSSGGFNGRQIADQIIADLVPRVMAELDKRATGAP